MQISEQGKVLVEHALQYIDKKELARANWNVIKPALEKAVKDTDNNWDDMTLSALELMIEKFFL